MFAILLCLTATTPPQTPVAIENGALVFRFTEWPPTTEEDKARARLVKDLRTLPRTLVDVDVANGGLVFRVAIDVMVLQKLRIDTSNARWSTIKKQFPDLRIAEARDEVWAYGPRSRVHKLSRVIQELERESASEDDGDPAKKGEEDAASEDKKRGAVKAPG